MSRPLRQAWRAVRFGFGACPGWLAAKVVITLVTAVVPVAAVWLT